MTLRKKIEKMKCFCKRRRRGKCDNENTALMKRKGKVLVRNERERENRKLTKRNKVKKEDKNKK